MSRTPRPPPEPEDGEFSSIPVNHFVVCAGKPPDRGVSYERNYDPGHGAPAPRYLDAETCVEISTGDTADPSPSFERAPQGPANLDTARSDCVQGDSIVQRASGIVAAPCQGPLYEFAALPDPGPSLRTSQAAAQVREAEHKALYTRYSISKWRAKRQAHLSAKWSRYFVEVPWVALRAVSGVPGPAHNLTPSPHFPRQPSSTVGHARLPAPSDEAESDNHGPGSPSKASDTPIGVPQSTVGREDPHYDAQFALRIHAGQDPRVDMNSASELSDIVWSLSVSPPPLPLPRTGKGCREGG